MTESSNRPLTSFTAVIVAAGSSARMRGIDKLWAEISGVSLLARTIGSFHDFPETERIAVVTSALCVPRVEDLVETAKLDKVKAVCEGGATRQQSVLAGLRALGGCDLVAVHDGARPLVTPDLIARGLALAREKGTALCAVPAKSTIKQVDAAGTVVATPPRDALWEAQTPQIFRYDELLAAHELAQERGLSYTDDAALMEAAGHKIWVYKGSYRNIKVTTPEDIIVAEALLGGES